MAGWAKTALGLVDAPVPVQSASALEQEIDGAKSLTITSTS